jgi:hypothetical protein
MRNYFFSAFLLCFLNLGVHAQNNDVLKDRKDLQNLLLERSQKFDTFTSSLEKRSGIFGNKTKKDIGRSNEVLIEIVKTDNRIISTLNRVIDFRNFEKTNMNYDVMQQNQNHDNLLHATDTLSKQVTALTAVNKSLKTKSQKLQWLSWLLFILSGVLGYMMFRKKYSATVKHT